MNTLPPIWCLILAMAAVSAFGGPKELKPSNVVIRSVFVEKVDIPDFRRHSFDIRQPERIEEPYLPKFRLLDPHFPEGFSVNTRLNGGPLRGDEGRIAEGIRALQKKDYSLAKNRFRSLLGKPGEFQNIAALWMARLAFAKSEFEDSAHFFATLHRAEHIEIRRDAVYYSALLPMKRGEYEKSLEFLNGIEPHLKRVDWDIRIGYAYLVALTLLERWQEAKDFLEEFEGRGISHSDRYYKVKEIGGIVYYALGDYERSKRHFAAAAKYFALPGYYLERRRNIAWIWYATGKIDQALQILNGELKRYEGEHREELQYLRLGCHLRKKDWERVTQLFGELSESSPFYIPAAYHILSNLVLSNLENVERYGDLYREVATAQYDVPAMRFGVALFSGHFHWGRGEFAQAEREYRQALSVAEAGENRWIALYNLALTHLQNGSFESAEELLGTEFENLPERLAHWVRYHRLFALFQLERYGSFLELEEERLTKRLEEKQQWEVRFMKAASLLHENRDDEAVSQFLRIWEGDGSVRAFEVAVRTLYRNNRFSRVVQLVDRYPEAETDLVFGYRIKSLLAERKFAESLHEIEKKKLTGDRLIDLRLEVWFANGMYTTVVKEITSLLQTTRDREKRAMYYLRLGDSYFSLQEYVKSKTQFYKALALISAPEERSPILYNLAVAAYLNGNYVSFAREASQALEKEQLTPDIRFRLTSLLVDHYIQIGNTEAAEFALEHYDRNFRYQNATLRSKRMTLAYTTEKYRKCFDLARKPAGEESDFQKKDRIIFSLLCARSKRESLASIALAQEELKRGEWKYRREELDFALSRAYYNSGKYEKSDALLGKVDRNRMAPERRLESHLLAAHNALLLEKPEEAEKRLGDVNRYRESKGYVRALHMKADIKRAQRDYNLAARTLLRLYYRSDTSAMDRQAILLKIAEILKEGDSPAEAESYFKEIDYSSIADDADLKGRYRKLETDFQGQKAG